jgi:hypothetical protein
MNMFAKADNDTLVQMMLQAAMPIMAQRLRQSPQFAGVIKKIADAELQATKMHTELVAKYAEIREELGDLLSENGLSFVAEEFVKHQEGQTIEVQPTAPAQPSFMPPPEAPKTIG